jgi:hypothetical protein
LNKTPRINMTRCVPYINNISIQRWTDRIHFTLSSYSILCHMYTPINNVQNDTYRILSGFPSVLDVAMKVGFLEKRRDISWTAAQGDFCSMLSQYSSLYCPLNLGNLYYVIIYSTVIWEYICKVIKCDSKFQSLHSRSVLKNPRIPVYITEQEVGVCISYMLMYEDWRWADILSNELF